MNTAVYPRKELTFESTRKKVDSVGTAVVSYIVFMNTNSVQLAVIVDFCSDSNACSAPGAGYTSTGSVSDIHVSSVTSTELWFLFVTRCTRGGAWKACPALCHILCTGLVDLFLESTLPLK
jgi:hypothetical protein